MFAPPATIAPVDPTPEPPREAFGLFGESIPLHYADGTPTGQTWGEMVREFSAMLKDAGIGW